MVISARYLLFHGSIVLLIGLLCGVPYGQALVNQKSDEAIRTWKLAHGALSLGAIAMIGMAAILSSLKVDKMVQWALAIAFIISDYGFSVALTIDHSWEIEAYLGQEYGLTKLFLLVMLLVL